MNEQKMHELWGHFHWLGVLAQQGSYTAAAARLGVSKAAVSQRIAELERTAGVPLVQRTTRSVRLTEAGQRLVDDTRASFEHIAQSFSQVRDWRASPAACCGSPRRWPSRASNWCRAWANSCASYPDVRLELSLSDHLSSLATEGFDLAIRHTANAARHPRGLDAVRHPLGAGGHQGLPAPPRHAPDAGRSGAATTACTTPARRTRPPGRWSP